MKATSKNILTSAAFTLLLTLLAGAAWADDAAKPASAEGLAKAMAEAGKPGPEHAKLEPLAGKWTYTCKFWMDPNQPPMQAHGTIERQWILGGRFLEEKFEGTGFDGQPGFEGRGLIGYDNAQQKYTSSWACSMGTGTCTGVGVSEAPGTFIFQTEAYCPLMKKTVKGRDEMRFEGNDKTVAQSYMTEDGKDTKVMEIVAVRKK